MRVLFALMLLLPTRLLAAELACPALVQATPAATVAAPAGWQVVQRPQAHALEFAELFIGDPAKLGQLRGEDADYPRLVFWDLTPEPEGYTLVCRYRDTQAVLQAPVPAAARRCEVRLSSANGQALRRGQAVATDARATAACR